MEKDLCASGIVILLFLVRWTNLMACLGSRSTLLSWSVWCSEQNKIYFLQQQARVVLDTVVEVSGVLRSMSRLIDHTTHKRECAPTLLVHYHTGSFQEFSYHFRYFSSF